MRSYKVKDVEHFVYDLESELPKDVRPIKNWRDGYPGDWVRADDNAYVQILERTNIGTSEAVRTCIGTYFVKGNLDTAERENRLSLDGKNGQWSTTSTFVTRKKANEREIKFARKVLNGKLAVDAYMEVYNANSKTYAKKRAALLLKTERVEKLMNPSKEDLEKVFNDQGVTLDLLISGAKEEFLNSKNGSDRLNALKMLWEAFGVVQTKKVTDVVGVFQGFEPAQIENVKREVLPKHQTHGDDPV